MARLTDDALRALVDDVAARLDPPGWITRPDEDPGVALLRLMASLADTLVDRSRPIPDHGQSVIAHIGERLGALTRPSCAHFSGGPRVRYLTGQILSAEDFQAEQDYLRAKRRLHNRWLHGFGVVAGLEVAVGANSTEHEPEVSIAPGCAISPAGEELVVSEPLVCRFAAPDASGFVSLRYVERGVRPAPGGARADDEPSRIDEGIAVDLAIETPRDSVAIARLTCVARRWQVDPGFQPARSPRAAQA